MLFCWRTHKVKDDVQPDTQQAEILQRLENPISNPNPNSEHGDVKESIDSLMLEFAASLVKHSDFKPEFAAVK